MGKIFMSDLADRLAEQTGMSKRDAQQFLSAVVETIQEGVNNDKIVKIKGLGTFKVIDVEARESVNVNTGERVTIDSHQKLTFTPDSAMKDLVNKPFSQFETVVLNDGVDFDDVKTESSEEAKVLEKHDEIEESKDLETSNVIEMHEEPVASEELVASEEPVASEESIASEKSEVEVPETPEVPETVENPIEPEVLKVADTTEVTSEIPEEAKVSEPVDSKQSYWWLWLLLAIVACVCSFAGGYILGRNIDRNSICDEEDSKSDTTITAVVNCQDTLTISTQNNDTLKADVQEISKQKTDSVNSDVLTKKTDEVAPDWKKYEDMDSRVRTGAYRIVGTDRVVKVKSGETMKRIANRILGEGMECYVEVYNNISSGQALKEGQEIKIPKLELKKKRKKE